VDKIADATPPPGANPETSGSSSTLVLSSLPLHLDLTAARLWGGPQVWHQTTPPRPHPSHRTGH
jgi:hypothetical protein